MAAQLLWGPLYFNDALVYARYGEYEAALRNLLVARRLLPGHAAVYLMLVKVEALRRRFRQAREWVAEAYRNRVLGRAAAEELLSGIAELTEARCLFLHGLAAPWVRLLRRVWSGIKHVS